LYEHDSFGLRSTNTLKDLARVLKKYSHTNTLIEAHTDSTGEEVYNQSLSEKRAHQVEEFLVSRGITGTRIRAKGYGEKQPLTANDTEAARQVNRRLEIAIYANEEFKNMAMMGKYRYPLIVNR
jgi:outer membrane protein OmpA-like peptidoglycan-associated protein